MSNVRVCLLFVLSVLWSTFSLGCARYQVVRVDSALTFEEGSTFVLLPSEGEEHPDALEQGFAEGLRANAGDYEYAAGDSVASGQHGIRFRVTAISREGQTSRVSASVSVVDESGQVPDEITMEVAREAGDERTALRAIGVEMGSRTSDFIHDREAHHY